MDFTDYFLLSYSFLLLFLFIIIIVFIFSWQVRNILLWLCAAGSSEKAGGNWCK